MSLDEFLTPAFLPAVKNIHIESCPELMTLPVDKLHGFSSLEEIIIELCPKLNTQMVTKLPSSLKKLTLTSCQGIESINLANGQLASSPVLEELSILRCSDLKSIGGAAAVDKIKKVSIKECHELKEIQQPLFHWYVQ